MLSCSYKDIYALTWSTVVKWCAADCKNILELIDLILTIPVNSADAERSFSEMKMVKSYWRSCLWPWVLSYLLFIMFHTNDIPTNDPSPAIHLWNVSGRQVTGPEQTPFGPRVQRKDTWISFWNWIQIILRNKKCNLTDWWFETGFDL